MGRRRIAHRFAFRERMKSVFTISSLGMFHPGVPAEIAHTGGMRDFSRGTAARLKRHKEVRRDDYNIADFRDEFRALRPLPAAYLLQCFVQARIVLNSSRWPTRLSQRVRRTTRRSVSRKRFSRWFPSLRGHTTRFLTLLIDTHRSARGRFLSDLPNIPDGMGVEPFIGISGQ